MAAVRACLTAGALWLAPAPLLAACGLPGPVPGLLLDVLEVAEQNYSPDVSTQQRLGAFVQRIETEGFVDTMRTQSGDDAANALARLVDQAYALIRGETLMEFSDVRRLTDVMWDAGSSPCLNGSSGGTADSSNSSSEAADASDVTFEPSAESVAMNTLADAQGVSFERLAEASGTPEPPNRSTRVLIALIAAGLIGIALVFVLRSFNAWILALIFGRKFCNIPAYLKLPKQTLHGFGIEIDQRSLTFHADTFMAKDAFKAMSGQLPQDAVLGLAEFEREVVIVATGDDSVMLDFVGRLGPGEYASALETSLIPPEFLSKGDGAAPQSV